MCVRLEGYLSFSVELHTWNHIIILQTVIWMLFYSNLIYSRKYSSSAAPYFQYLNTYSWQHVSAKKIFAKTAFQIRQALSQFYYRFLKFRKCFGQWFLFYSSQCFITYVFYGWFLPINIFIKPLTTRKNNLFFKAWV